MIKRRTFIAATGASVVSAAISNSTDARERHSIKQNIFPDINRDRLVDTAKQKIKMALIGCGGQGNSLAKRFQQQQDVDVVYVCDPDENRRNKTAASLGNSPKSISDFRIALDDKTVDAVFIATPDHWHVPASLLAIDSGKHVYVEKPCSHNIAEGRMLVEKAKSKNAIVQHGTHSRSIKLLVNAIQALRENVIGEVLVAKAWNVQRRGEIGKSKPSSPPNGFDYDTWVGPAPMVPFQSNRHHYTWHWWYDFGTGDTGNDGVHELDIARWGLGVQNHPSSAGALGGKLVFDDDQQFPDTQFANFFYPGSPNKQLQFEMRLWSKYGLNGFDNGNAFYGEGGWMLLSKRGTVKIFDENNRERDDVKMPNLTPAEHTVNFINTIRGEETLTAPIQEGHLSATLCHLANISSRVGRSLAFDPIKETIDDDKEASGLLSRSYRDHWARPDFAKD